MPNISVKRLMKNAEVRPTFRHSARRRGVVNPKTNARNSRLAKATERQLPYQAWKDWRIPSGCSRSVRIRAARASSVTAAQIPVRTVLPRGHRGPGVRAIAPASAGLSDLLEGGKAVMRVLLVTGCHRAQRASHPA